MNEIIKNFLMMEIEFLSSGIWREIFSWIAITLFMMTVVALKRFHSDDGCVLFGIIAGQIGLHLTYIINVNSIGNVTMTCVYLGVVITFIYTLLAFICKKNEISENFKSKPGYKIDFKNKGYEIILSIISCGLSIFLLYTFHLVGVI